MVSHLEAPLQSPMPVALASPLEAHITWHNEVNHDILSPSQMQWPAELWATVWLDRGGRRGLRTFSILIPDACSRQSQEDIF